MYVYKDLFYWYCVSCFQLRINNYHVRRVPLNFLLFTYIIFLFFVICNDVGCSEQFSKHFDTIFIFFRKNWLRKMRSREKRCDPRRSGEAYETPKGRHVCAKAKLESTVFCITLFLCLYFVIKKLLYSVSVFKHFS